MPFCVSHFEVAKSLGIESADFHVGNIIPDICHCSSLFSKDETHFITYEPHKIYGNIPAFIEKNIKHRTLDESSYYFALGHLTHIITDLVWGEVVYLPVLGRYKDEEQRLKRYVALQYKLINELFARWQEEGKNRQEFENLDHYAWDKVTLTYPFCTVHYRKLIPIFTKLIFVQSNIKSSFHINEEELYQYEKEIKRHLDPNFYEIFLEKAQTRVLDTLQTYSLKLDI